MVTTRKPRKKPDELTTPALRIAAAVDWERMKMLLSDKLRREPTDEEIDAGITANPIHSAAYQALLSRAKAMYELTKDENMVRYIFVSIVRDSKDTNFNAATSFSYLSFERMRRELEIPEGGYGYALWADGLEQGDLKRSLEYWLGFWADCIDAQDLKGILYAKHNLDLLGNAFFKPEEDSSGNK